MDWLEKDRCNFHKHCNVVVRLESFYTALSISGFLKVLPDQDLERLIMHAYLDDVIMLILLNEIDTSFSSFLHRSWLVTVYIVTAVMLPVLSAQLTDTRGL